MRLFFTIFLFVLVNCNTIIPQWIPQNSNTSQRLLTNFFLDENRGWAGGNEGCIMRTTDGGNNWVYYSIDTKYTVHSIHFIDSLKGWAAIYTYSPEMAGSIITTLDGGETWSFQYTVNYETLHHIQFVDNNYGWVVGSSGIYLRSTNGGATWIQDYFYSGEWAWGMYFIDQNIGWCSDGTSGYIKKTNDGGLTWQSYYTSTQSRIFGIYFLNNLIGWAAGDYGTILKTVNGGITWTIQNSGLNNQLRDIKFINEYIGWAIGIGGVIVHTTDGGFEWYRQGDLVNNDLFGLSIKSEMLGWIAGSGGIILKTENGGGDPLPVELISFTGECNGDEIVLHWTTASELNNSGFEIEMKSLNNEWRTIGFVKGSGTTTETRNYNFTDQVENNSPAKYQYRLKQIDFNGAFEYSNEIEVNVNIPSEYKLYQNYPNPFNPSTNIQFQMPERSQVSLKIYDILGNEVETLFNEVKDAGIYDYDFNSGSLASGIYFYALQTEKFSKSHKMVLLK